MKRCHKCNIEKPAASFYADKSRRDGLQCRCKECQREETRIRMARPHNRVGSRAAALRWRLENPDEHRTYQAEWKKRITGELLPTYVAGLIARTVGCSAREVPMQLIQAKALVIKTKRLISERKK